MLVWGVAAEPTLGALLHELDLMSVPTVVVDQRQALRCDAEMYVDKGVRGWLKTPEAECDLREIGAAYVRTLDARGDAAAFEGLLWSWLDLTPALVVNPVRAAASNGSKPYQLRMIAEQGFRVPETLVTTDPEVAHQFWHDHDTVIYKSISAVRSTVTRLQPHDIDRLEDVRHCPTQFQQYVPGVDHRVHVVGQDAFPCRIETDACDYRYANGARVQIEACALAADVIERCVDLAAALDLTVAGVDLRCTPDGDWYCFEVNPSPAFGYYEAATGQPLGRAIASLLARADRGARR